MKTQILVKALMISGLGLGLLSSAATETVNDTISAAPVRIDTSAQAEMISTMAVRSLRYIADARSAVSTKHYTQASQDLAQASSLFQMIGHNLPLIRIKDEISIAKQHLDYEDTVLVEPDLIPIYAELGLFQDVPSQSRLRAALDRVKSFLHLGKKNEAKKELAQLDAAIVYTQVNLPLKETETLVTSAREQLAKKDYHEADTMLQRAEGKLRVNVTALVAPVNEPAKKAE